MAEGRRTQPVLAVLLAVVVVLPRILTPEVLGRWYWDFVFAAGFCASLVLGAMLVRRPWAWLGLDDPSGVARKDQGHAIPTVGLALLVLPCLPILMPASSLGSGSWNQWLALLMLCLVGWLDDLGGKRLGWRPKLAAQALILGFYVLLPVRLDPAGGMELVVDQVLFLVFGLVVLNAWNFFDHADGIAAAAALGSLLVVLLPLLIQVPELWVAGGPEQRNAWFPDEAIPLLFASGMLLLSLCGALAGFLVWNFPGAHLYMGDQGSHAIGFAMLAFVGYPLASLHRHAETGAPELAVGRVGPEAIAWLLLPSLVPVLDLVQVTVRRLLAGTPPWRPDRRHLAHVLAARGIGPRETVVLVFVLQFAGFWLLSRIR